MSRRQQTAANVAATELGGGRGWWLTLKGSEPAGEGATEAIAAIELAAELRSRADAIDTAYRGQANRDVLARGMAAVKVRRDAAPEPGPRSHLSTSGGAWRVIHDGMPLAADVPTEAAAVAAVAKYGDRVDLSHGWIWDGDAGAWRKPEPETRGDYTNEGEAY